MKIEIKENVTVNITKILLDLPIRYDEEDIPNNFPCRIKCTESHYGEHDRLILMVDVETGEILTPEFPRDFEYEIQDMKVCDEGIYILYDDEDNIIAKKACYVPDCVPGTSGDYVNLDIKDGYIINWVSFKQDNINEFDKI